MKIMHKHGALHRKRGEKDKEKKEWLIAGEGGLQSLRRSPRLVLKGIDGWLNDFQNHADPALLFLFFNAHFHKHYLLYYMTPELEGIQDLLKNTLVRQKAANMGQKTGIPPRVFEICIKRYDLQCKKPM